jgi:hypothetical protein
MSQEITETLFSELLEDKLGEQYNRALVLFRDSGKLLSFDVVNVLLHASEKNEVENVLTELEKHWEEHLQYQHPEIRGTIHNSVGINQTELMFLNICENVLKLAQ